MAITIDWGNRVIYVPKDDLTIVQNNPSEIRSMDLNWFRLQLKNLEDSETGMIFPDTHKHNTEVYIGGLTYARVIEIINGYTITFEDGQYAVNLVGANSNVGDRVNVNSVSVRSFNSAGLISSPAIEYASFNDGVTIDVNNGTYGTLYPTGTLQKPVNNIEDAIAIAEHRGFKNLYFISDFVFTSNTNINGFNLYGGGAQQTLLTFQSGAITANCSCYNAKVTGRSFGVTYLENCHHYNYGGSDLAPSNRTIINRNCIIEGESYIPSQYTGSLFVIDCWSAGADEKDAPVVNMNGSACNIITRNYNGATVLSNCNNPAAKMSYDFNSGILIVDETVVSGSMDIRGTGKLINNSKYTFNLDYDGLMSKNVISSSVWEEDISVYDVGNSAAAGINTIIGKLPEGNIASASEYLLILNRIVGLLQENQYIDQTVYTTYKGQKLMTSGRIRIYSDTESTGSDNNVVASYRITTTWNEDEMTSYKVQKI